MCVDRRDFLRFSTGVAGAALLGADDAVAQNTPDAIRQLGPLPGKVAPITDDERSARIEKARRLMVENNIDAIYLESGSSLFYYTGVRWGQSERMFALVIPARGELAWVCPKFEEMRARELIRFGSDVRTWEEDESPYKLVAQVFKDRGVRTGRVGMEERVRFFLFDGIRNEARNLEYVSADSALIGFGKYTAFPHGSVQPQQLREGDVVLMDGGCGVEGYQSDITRTFVFGKPTARQTEIRNLERKAQDAALASAKVGATCEPVHAAARTLIIDAGFGPDYKIPGLPHRTGHGIGLDGHEWTNFVRGNKTKLQPGMCFSDEPMIAIYGEFGVRLEDCLYIAEDGPKMFSKQSPSIDQPFG